VHPLLEFDRQFSQKGFSRFAGVDEAGRGPLAGPVVAAAVVLNREFIGGEPEGLVLAINDSKKLSSVKREAIYAFLVSSPHVAMGVGISGSDEIDRINILRATHAAMRRALEKITPLPDHALVDGLPVPGLPCPSTAVVGGDGKSLSIAAASIVAKVVRDRMMCDLDRQYPQYGMAAHKGYGTAAHIKVLLEYGPCPVHRRSFQPVRDAEQIASRAAREGGCDGK